MRHYPEDADLCCARVLATAIPHGFTPNPGHVLDVICPDCGAVYEYIPAAWGVPWRFTPLERADGIGRAA